MGVKEDIDQKIASKPVYVVSKSFCPFCKIAKQVLQRYNIPANNILIQADMWAMFDDVCNDITQKMPLLVLCSKKLKEDVKSNQGVSCLHLKL